MAASTCCSASQLHSLCFFPPSCTSPNRLHPPLSLPTRSPPLPPLFNLRILASSGARRRNPPIIGFIPPPPESLHGSFSSAPPLSDSGEPGELEERHKAQHRQSGIVAGDNGEGVQLQMAESNGGPQGFLGAFPSLRQLKRKIVRQLASFPLAIGELFVIAGLCAVGTFIEQGESPEFYFQKYSEDNPAFGFLSWRWVLGLSLDHVYSAPYFLGLLVLLAASLMACTSTRQLPIVKIARRWSFLSSGDSISRLEVSDTLPGACLTDLGILLMSKGYQVFVQGPALYAFKGLAGRFAPIGVHAALLMVMGGATLSATGGYHGSIMVPQGLNFIVGEAVTPNGILSRPVPTFNTEVHVNKFSIDSYPNGEVAQFHSDLSLSDANGKELFRKTISVNDPLRFGGFTMYQTDWAISAIQLHVDGAGPFNLAVAPLQGGDKKLFGTFLPLGDKGLNDAKGISILARDLQSVVIYDSAGNFGGVRRSGSNRPISVDGVELIIDDVIGSTGLELKLDPGVPLVYAGFGALMLTTCLSYLSHSQVWALQDGTSVVVGGKSNRAKLDFQRELDCVLDSVPEIVNQTMLGKDHIASLQGVQADCKHDSLQTEQIAEPTEKVLAS